MNKYRVNFLQIFRPSQKYIKTGIQTHQVNTTCFQITRYSIELTLCYCMKEEAKSPRIFQIWHFKTCKNKRLYAFFISMIDVAGVLRYKQHNSESDYSGRYVLIYLNIFWHFQIRSSAVDAIVKFFWLRFDDIRRCIWNSRQQWACAGSKFVHCFGLFKLGKLRSDCPSSISQYIYGISRHISQHSLRVLNRLVLS